MSAQRPDAANVDRQTPARTGLRAQAEEVGLAAPESAASVDSLVAFHDRELFGALKVLRSDLRSGFLQPTNVRLGEWLAANIDALIALDPTERALDRLADTLMESGQEIGEEIERRRERRGPHV